MKAIIISCGDELVTGQCIDTNSAWLSTQLVACGTEIAEHVTVGDSIRLLRDAIMLTARLLCFGISEATLGEQLRDLMACGRNPSVGTTASHAELSVRIVARGADEGSARELLEREVAELRARLGNAVFGEDEE